MKYFKINPVEVLTAIAINEFGAICAYVRRISLSEHRSIWIITNSMVFNEKDGRTTFFETHSKSFQKASRIEEVITNSFQSKQDATDFFLSTLRK